ncbi:3-oxoacyl-[acyl-carrier-protein] synthase 2 [Anaerobiospirillum thomasii]|uniref:3-oxoacyl-[acyl-carrier-protein] synthase 2 n=1 Tax=Anaerobiospirillum thomasii TaxID=179995 RepID=A0A2X0V4S0_9GAMM|nr:beta-ketoacyl-ACP synthase II [Anaerobiospirillum thomasii]SPT67735.1 3-oxoacyl-[acyl-carrier-protein] synthase 2 [Anaerobiospirillum thomasii]SPT70193.1 3-oxoacyl-[acyl-carrier-protein] synthase 2 [Anaerobiospirillum thomasii]
MQKRRVVVTGLGMLSPVGNTAEESFKALCAGKSGISTIEHFDTSAFSVKIAGLIKNFNPEDWGISRKDERKMDLFIQYGIAAGIMAFADSGLEVNESNAHRIGTMVGSGIGGLGLIEQNITALVAKGPRGISPFFVPSTIINMVSGHLSILKGLRGPNLATVTACASGTHAIGLSARLIACGDADAMICGGSEKASTQMGIGGFSALKALSTRNDEPERASRPWDVDRDGFVLGDGAGVLVLEEYEHAKARGAKIYAELVGFGMSGDAYHMTATAEDGSGARLSMENAIRDAGIKAEQIGYINAHGTSTHIGDLSELRAVKNIFGEAPENTCMSSTKSMTGHLLGAAGAIEAVITTMAVHDQICPPTINLDNPDPEVGGFNLVANVAQSRSFEYALTNSFGFGGTNGSLIFKKI